MSKEDENFSPEHNMLVAQQIAAALFVAKSGSGANAHALVNAFNLQESEKKTLKAHYDKLGQTVPTSAAVLAMDAARKIRHSRILTSNMYKADNFQIRLPYVDAHHIVGRLHFHANDARMMLFGWGIGINDADNGVYLPRHASTKIASMPNAHNHQGLHTYEYYFNVTMRLDSVKDDTASEGRASLREIRNELIAGTFSF